MIIQAVLRAVFGVIKPVRFPTVLGDTVCLASVWAVTSGNTRLIACVVTAVMFTHKEELHSLCRASIPTILWATPVETPPRTPPCTRAVLGCQWRRVPGRRACSATWPEASRACTTSWKGLLKEAAQRWKAAPWREQVQPPFWQSQGHFHGTNTKTKLTYSYLLIDVYFECITNLPLSLRR